MNIIGHRKIFYTVSALMIAAGVLALVFWGIKPGIDFAGGSLIEISLAKPVADQAIKDTLKDFDLGNYEIIPKAGNSYLLRFKFVNEKTHQEILSTLKEKFPSLEEKKFETVGPVIGKELKDKAYFAGILALIGIALYVAFAFSKVSKPVSSWKYGVITVLTLFHDAFIALGGYVIWAHFSGAYADSALVVALLTVIGYSVNDTIVVFDRTRENLRKKLGQLPFNEIVNQSVNETLARSINTSLTTCLPLIALLIFGPASLFNFILVMLIGIIVGTYSSIFISSPLLVTWAGEK